MHDSIARWIERMDAEHGPFSTILEIGSLNVNGSIREHFTTSRTPEIQGHPEYAFYVGIDVAEGEGVDIVADGADFELGLGRWNCVVTTGALEHTPRAREIVFNAYRLLRPGGTFLCSAAGTEFTPHSCYGGHEGPEDGEYYQNITGADMEAWLTEAGFKTFDVRDDVDLFAWAKKEPQ